MIHRTNYTGATNTRLAVTLGWSLVLVLMLISGTGTASVMAKNQQQPGVGRVLEALKRLPAEQVKRNPALAAKAREVAEAVQGQPEYLELVRKFEIQGQGSNLAQMIVSDLDANSKAEAARLLLLLESEAAIKEILKVTPKENHPAWAQAFGNSGRSEAVWVLKWILNQPETTAEGLTQAVEGLTKYEQGSEWLLDLAKQGNLPKSVRLRTASLLNRSQWESVRAEASEILPLPPSKNTEPLPPIEELIQLSGDPLNGEKVFYRAESLCALCHQVGDQGAAFGPALTEIGSKLGKDALYAAILDPNAGVSFGYETTTLTLDSGDTATGIIVSETDQQIVLGMAGGITTPYEKERLLDRSTEAISMMPAGLQQTMTTQELVDLVEFLSELKTRK